MSIRAMIEEDLGLDDGYLEALASRSDSLYHERRVGRRMLDIPSSELKLVQMWIGAFLKEEDRSLPGYVTAYEPGCSIVKNAALHAHHAHVLAFDIHHFFQSCSKQLVTDLFCDTHYVDGLGHRVSIEDGEAQLLAELCCYHDALAMGSPSSPFVANRVMVPYDREIIDSLPDGVAYSRYSDDITISSDWYLDESKTLEIVSSALGEAGFVINAKKTRRMGRGNSRRITGVYITPDGSLSMGKQRKRLLRNLTYRVLSGRSDEVNRLLGMLAFCGQVEPEYLALVLSKYASCGAAGERGGVMPALYDLKRKLS